MTKRSLVTAFALSILTLENSRNCDAKVADLNEFDANSAIMKIATDTEPFYEPDATESNSKPLLLSESFYGKAGNDTYCGSTSDDSVKGDSGADRLHGKEGDDIIEGGSDDDHYDAGPSGDADSCYGNGGSDRVSLPSEDTCKVAMPNDCETSVP